MAIFLEKTKQLKIDDALQIKFLSIMNKFQGPEILVIEQTDKQCGHWQGS